ncbi:MAG: type II toxin-antitoxin system HicB family antitoxin [bacterium]
MKFKVIITPDEDGGFIAEVPELPGCLSQGDSRDEALKNIKDAIQGWIKVRLMRKEFSSATLPPEFAFSDTEEVEV